MSMQVFMLPIGDRDRASFYDLLESGVRAGDACDLIAALRYFRGERGRLHATRTVFARYGMTAAAAHSWLLARRFVGGKRPRRRARWGSP